MPYSSETSVTEAFSMETRRSISYLTCTASRIEELAFLKLWIAHLLGRRIERALFEESIGLCALAVVLRRHPQLRAYESLT
jgi:hypothetical protein